MQAGIYIHVPFCKSRCIYCDFVSSTLGHEWQQRYIRALGGEMRAREIVDTWGGTDFSQEPRHQRRIDKMMALEK